MGHGPPYTPPEDVATGVRGQRARRGEAKSGSVRVARWKAQQGDGVMDKQGCQPASGDSGDPGEDPAVGGEEMRAKQDGMMRTSRALGLLGMETDLEGLSLDKDGHEELGKARFGRGRGDGGN